jgi:hypothetical protein
MEEEKNEWTERNLIFNFPYCSLMRLKETHSYQELANFVRNENFIIYFIDPKIQ